MNQYTTEFYARKFSHIYIEEGALNYDTTRKILAQFKASQIIIIKHYKDIFNRAQQDFLLQKKSQSLILAVNNGELIYPGANVCQSFNNEHFYYTSNVMNCIYDCEYCYLQGMYPSANIVVFVNIDSYFEKIKEILLNHPMYICVSYDTDLLALEGFLGFVKKWTDFAAIHHDLKIEIRTKSSVLLSSYSFYKGKNVIFAWTLSPEQIVERFEHNTPSLTARLNAIKNAVRLGYTVRLCFDPMIYVPDYQKLYSELYHTVFNEVPSSVIQDVSLGLFRISANYIKQMRKKRFCEVTEYPYTNDNGVCSYGAKKSCEMLDFARFEISKYLPANRLFDS